MGYYANHSIKRNNEFVFEHFPIPVITVKGICDIGIDLELTFLEGRLTREQALKFNYYNLKNYVFEVYGVENYLNDFYNETLNINEIAKMVENSAEYEVNISVYLKKNEGMEEVLKLVSKFEEWNIYL